MSTSSIAHLYRSLFKQELKHLSRVDVFSLSFAVKDLAVCALSAAITDDRARLLSHKVKFYDCMQN